MKFSRSAAAVVACACLALMGCAETKKEIAGDDKAMGAMKADNALCPITGRPVNADMKPVAFDGKQVGFCCSNCSGKWNTMTSAQKTEAWNKMMAAK